MFCHRMGRQLILVVGSLVLVFTQLGVAPTHADTPDLTEWLLPRNQIRCGDEALGVMADVDGNGTQETMVVFNTLPNGEAYSIVSTNHEGSTAYLFSGANAHCGGTHPYQTGRFTVWFVDALAPGFVANQPNTWIFTSVPGIRLVASSDAILVGGLASGYRQIRAYTARNQGGSLVGSYQSHSSDPWPGPLADQTCSFSSPSGIMEVHLRSDFAENELWSFVIMSHPCSGPTITTQPAGQTVCAGGITSFSVTASASDPISYQWWHDGVLMDGAVASTLTIPAATTADDGNYWCVLTTICGSVTSATAALAIDCDTILYRVNAGGAQLPSGRGGPDWSTDTAAAPSPYVNAVETGNATGASGATIDMTDPSLPPGTPMALFQDERWDPPGGGEMHWAFYVGPGTFKVRLYFAELYGAITAPGMRLFNVYANGQNVLPSIDMFAEAGPNKAFMREFTVTISSPLNYLTLDFQHQVENPAIGAIEILDSCEIPAIQEQPQPHQACPGETVSFSVTPTSQAPATFQWFHNGQPLEGAIDNVLTIANVGNGDYGTYGCRLSNGCGFVDSDVVLLARWYSCDAVYRVNAGGPWVASTDGGANWMADTAATPSPHVNAIGTGNMTGSTEAALDMSDPSLPPDTPAALFQDERWDPPGGEELHWSFPVDTGIYTVRLYFREMYWAITAPGQRIFTVRVNGRTVLPSFDMFARAGQNRAFACTFPVQMDASDRINIDFVHETENPAIAAIEILVGAVAAAPPPTAETMRLRQNVPNPFNPRTTIAFTLPTASRVSLCVYDQRGHLVRTLMDEDLLPGVHSRDWDGRDDANRPAAAGVYHYKLRRGSQSETRRMTLVR